MCNPTNYFTDYIFSLCNLELVMDYNLYVIYRKIQNIFGL